MSPGEAMEVTTRAILERSVKWLRDPAHGVSGVGIGDGFASQRPREAGSTIPVGLTAIDKHPYPRRISYPDQAILNGSRPTDALGREGGSLDAAGRWVDSFTPTYVSYFPEYALSAIQTEHMIRDLSPLTTEAYGTRHGRRTRPAGGNPPELWITELNLVSYAVRSAARERFQAKVALRSIVSFVAKGASAVDLFAARAVEGGQFGLVPSTLLQGSPRLAHLPRRCRRRTRPRLPPAGRGGAAGPADRQAPTSLAACHRRLRGP